MIFVALLFFQKEIALDRENTIVNAVKKCRNAVVSITCFTTRYVSLAPSIFNDPFFRDFLEFFEFPEFKEKVSSQGSGFIISEDGYILTNEHVISNSDSIVVFLPDGRNFIAKVLGKDYSLDIALLKIDGKNLPYLTFADSDKLERGEWAIAMGNPFGYLWEDVEPTVTVGVISALNRTFKGEGDRIYRGMIQTDASINPGNSGGPLLNLKGEVIGMNTFIVSKSGGFEGIGFAIPSNLLKTVVNYLKLYSYYPRGFLGLEVKPTEKGVVIVTILEGGPADKAGLRPGDIIIKIGKDIIRSYSDFRRKVDLLRKDESVPLMYERNVKRNVTNIIPESKLENFLHVMGITLKDEKNGVVINSVKRGRYAERLGLKEGDFIVKVEDIEVESIKDIERVLCEYVKKEKKWTIKRGRYYYDFVFKEMD
ncbi:MAG: trypsin-like peptidase domain-containing protein [Candidatus Hydrothermales bacterium]